MKSEEIIDKLHSYLDEHLRGSRGSVYQEPYKRDIFALFQEAYREGYFQHQPGEHLLSADSLGDILIARWFSDDGKNDARERLLGELMPMWQEWRYACDRYQKKPDIGDDTHRMRRPQLSASDLFKVEVDELEAINDMIQKFIRVPSQEGKVHVKAHLARWLKHDASRSGQ